MPWSLSIGRLFGSEIRIHITFLILLVWVGVAAYGAGGAVAAVDSVGFVLAIFACVVAHELGHALAARRYGIATPDITLLPIGGMARLEKMPERPVQEIIVALAGPAVNVVIAGVLMLIAGVGFDAQTLASLENSGAGFLVRLASLNIFLVVFNLIPAFPMDGGRVLRALLALKYPRADATRYAARAGQALAFALGFLGLMSGNVLLVFIAVFVYMAAAGESYQVGMEDASRSVCVRDVMITEFETLATNATLTTAADALLRTTQHEFPIVDGAGQLRGILTRKGMMRALARSGRDTPAIEAMDTEIPLVRGHIALSQATRLMQEAGKPAIGVVDGDNRLVGYVTPENLGEFMMLAQTGALAKRTPRQTEPGPF
ncbi:site-2 protease family protein [Consotaella salsifontis]|uniref:Zinc metalloprotease n=1 Tax=Consotaella salsifontis TaxID=1365950 RepID=A0A1T4RYS8_9HYPH|nr:site-2 protease family protein [Consotaella salsifontis]SKA20858.1 stage IV sporulation protein FB [Consotaella salsifontis]